ncbi:MAG: hypothetical protein JWP35_2167 [Caulobacter sp.]|nr:hypothetical protein [Caulobacter sp.]
MEADAPPPTFDYYYVGEGAGDFCGGTYGNVLTAMEMKRGWITKGAPEGPAIKAWRSGPLAYSIVLKDQPAYPAVIVYYQTPQGWAVASACGYGDEKAFRLLMAISGVGPDAIGVYRAPK